MRLGKTALYHFGTQVVVTVAGFAATFVIATVLGSADLGLYTAAVAIGFFWLVIPANGVSKAIKKRMSEGDEPARYYGGGVVLNALLSVALGSFVLGAGWFLSATSPPEVVLVQVLVEYDVEIATLLVGSTALKTALAGLEGEKLVARSGGMKAIDRVGRSVVQISLIAVGFGVTAITLGHAAVLLFVALLALATASIRPAMPTRDHLESLVEFAKYGWVGVLRGRVYGWLDTLVLSAFLASASLVGMYELAWGIGSVLATASGSINATLFPEMSELSADGDHDQISHYLDEALAFGGLIVIPGLAGAVVIGPRVLRFYRPEYVRAQYVLIALVAAYVADVYATQIVNVVNALDRPDVAMRVSTAFIATNVVLNVALVWTIGWFGAALATAISAGVRVTYGYVALSSLLDRVSLPVRTVGAEAAAALVMAGALVGVEAAVPHGRVWTLALVGGGAALYFAALFAFSGRVRSKTQSLVGAFDRVAI